MKLYLMTDLEGVAGVMYFEEWCSPGARYYELAKEFLTMEVNAAVEGFFQGGVTEIMVADGHGPGAISPKLLDPRVELMRGWPMGWPVLLDDSYDAVAWVGQHAKAGTEYAHLAHTQSFNYLDLSVNGISIGEFGQFAMCANELGVRAIFGAGDEAFTREAAALVPGIETVSVKRGTTPGKGDEMTTDPYRQRNTAAIHLHPDAACKRIREGSNRAIQRAIKEDFGRIEMAAPFERVCRFRATADQPSTIARESHPTSFIALMNCPYDRKPER
ncbi:MAG: M55 family metallopeptidase [Candidatus Latescibacterota bacterium]